MAGAKVRPLPTKIALSNLTNLAHLSDHSAAQLGHDRPQGASLLQPVQAGADGLDKRPVVVT